LSAAGGCDPFDEAAATPGESNARSQTNAEERFMNPLQLLTGTSHFVLTGSGLAVGHSRFRVSRT
jgi:hypothetical protein